MLRKLSGLLTLLLLLPMPAYAAFSIFWYDLPTGYTESSTGGYTDNILTWSGVGTPPAADGVVYGLPDRVTITLGGSISRSGTGITITTANPTGMLYSGGSNQFSPVNGVQNFTFIDVSAGSVPVSPYTLTFTPR
jgi:hypothetical protein